MLRLLSFLFLVSAFFSCLPEKTALERALREAGDNRMELEKVLAYYRDDTLKYQAACFLIENMPDQYAVLPLDSTDTYARALLSLDKEDPVSWEISRSLVAAVFDSISKIQPENRRLRYGIGGGWQSIIHLMISVVMYCLIGWLMNLCLTGGGLPCSVMVTGWIR